MSDGWVHKEITDLTEEISKAGHPLLKLALQPIPQGELTRIDRQTVYLNALGLCNEALTVLYQARDMIAYSSLTSEVIRAFPEMLIDLGRQIDEMNREAGIE